MVLRRRRCLGIEHMNTAFLVTHSQVLGYISRGTGAMHIGGTQRRRHAMLDAAGGKIKASVVGGLERRQVGYRRKGHRPAITTRHQRQGRATKGWPRRLGCSYLVTTTPLASQRRRRRPRVFRRCAARRMQGTRWTRPCIVRRRLQVRRRIVNGHLCLPQRRWCHRRRRSAR